MFRTQKGGTKRSKAGILKTQVKGWNKCNVYCCTIFSNKRTQNVFVLFYINTPITPFFSISIFFSSLVSVSFPSSNSLFFLLPLNSIVSSDVCSCTAHFSVHLMFVTSVPAKHGHKPCQATSVSTAEGEQITQLCSRASETLSSLCYYFCKNNVYILFFFASHDTLCMNVYIWLLHIYICLYRYIYLYDIYFDRNFALLCTSFFMRWAWMCGCNAFSGTAGQGVILALQALTSKIMLIKCQKERPKSNHLQF